MSSGIDRSADGDASNRIVGETPSVRALRQRVRAIAPLDSSVLITGETGTGKGLVARVLHDLSGRRARPFVHVDCAALSPTLIESELFGHERGAFTSADNRRAGRFELAGEGTIFLDEIGDLEAKLQAKLLRVLEDREFERIGGTETLGMRSRVIAATSHDLRSAMEDLRFRPDLFFRLNVFHLELPALRDRLEDIPLLVGSGLRDLSSRLGVVPPIATPQFHLRLMAHSWPGNIRELMNLLERAAVTSPGQVLYGPEVDEHLERWEHASPESAGRWRHRTLAELINAVSEAERREILEALERSKGNVSSAARRLRIPRSTLRYRLRKLNLADD